MGSVQFDEIVAIEDPVLRNLRITQAYYELGTALSERGFGADASWLLFAVWASKTAGSVIRGEELPECLHREVQESRAPAAMTAGNKRWAWLRRLGMVADFAPEHLERLVGAVADDVSRSIADGNVRVFEEVCPLFMGLLEGTPDPTGLPDDLRTAMLAYRQALTEEDPEKRAVLLLSGNVAAVAHEQRRLQQDIDGALDAVVTDGLSRVVDDDLLRWLPKWLGRAVATRVFGELADELEEAWRRVATAIMLRLVTADERLELSRDLPPLRGRPLFPDALMGDDAIAAVAGWDKTGGSGTPSRAADWSILHERMNYIVNFFRSRQQHPALATPPFSADQLVALGSGAIPAPPL